MKPGDADDGPARDPWLSQALRHAPDADVVPPAALSAAILREARAAAARPAAAPAAPKQRLRAWWAWLATPPVAAGFASLMVATVVGLMWWDRPLDEAVAERDLPAAVAPAAAEAPAIAQATPAAPAVADQAVAPAPPLAARPEARRVDEATRQRRAEVVAPQRDAAEPRAKADARGLAASETRAAAAPAQEAAAQATANAALRATSDAVAAAPDAAAAVPRPRPSLTRQVDTARGSAAQPVQQLRAAIAADPGRWAWQRGDAAPRPADAATLHWLDQLAQALQPDTGAATAGPAPSAAADADATGATAAITSLQWRLDGGVYARLRLSAGRVEFSTVGIAGTTSQASLTPAAGAALRTALAAAFD